MQGLKKYEGVSSQQNAKSSRKVADFSRKVADREVKTSGRLICFRFYRAGEFMTEANEKHELGEGLPQFPSGASGEAPNVDKQMQPKQYLLGEDWAALQAIESQRAAERKPVKSAKPEATTKLPTVTFWEAKGIYQKVVGRVVTKWDGEDYDIQATEFAPKKFYLGSDKAAAQANALRLMQLWDEVTTKVMPWWDPFYLEVAKAICHGQHVFVIQPNPRSLPVSPEQQLMRIAQLNTIHASIRFMPSDVLLFKQAEPAILQRAQSHVEEARTLTVLVNGKDPVLSSQGVHQALEVFSQHLRETHLARGGGGFRKTSEWGFRMADNVQRLKDSIKDMPLHQFGYDAIGACATYWKSRPFRKGTEKPISVETVKVQIKILRRFIDWLDATDSFKWSAPSRWMKATSFRSHDILTDEEQLQSARGNKAKSYSVEELAIIYKYTTRWEQLLVLLGLNFGFAQAEIQSLRVKEVDLQKRTIERVRRKKGVFSKFLIWPETVELLTWAFERRNAQTTDVSGNDIQITGESYLVLTEDGQPVYRLTDAGNRSDSIANAWNCLLNRIRRDHPDFRKLGFKYLRKTAGNFVRSVSDGEVAGTFHSRANVVRTDDEADDYTDRPYVKVFAAQEKVRDILAPMFAARTGYGEAVTIGSTGLNIGLKKIDAIQSMFREGKAAKMIAKELGVSMATVYKYRPVGE